MPSEESVGEVGQYEGASEALADMTGRAREEFEADGYEYPDLDELESVDS